MPVPFNLTRRETSVSRTGWLTGGAPQIHYHGCVHSNRLPRRLAVVWMQGAASLGVEGVSCRRVAFAADCYSERM